MKCNWLIGSIFIDENLEKLVNEIKRQGFSVKFQENRLGLTADDLYKHYGPDECVVCYGSIATSQLVLKSTSWVPGAFLDMPQYECSTYYSHFGDYLLNNQYIMLPFGDLDRTRNFLLRSLETEAIFVRPSTGFKLFTGTVLKDNNWKNDLSNLKFNQVESHKMVVVAPAQEIRREWRLAIADEQVIAGTQYMNCGEIDHQSDCPNSVWEFGRQVLAGCPWRPERVWTMDIGELKDKLAVVEINSFSAAGLYCCEKEPVVREVSRIALEMWQEYQKEVSR